jgi:LCP family protein required for cell wall assembly
MVPTRADAVSPGRMALRTVLVTLLGLAVFYAIVRIFDSWTGAAIAAVVGALVTGLSWWMWRRSHSPSRPQRVLGAVPRLGIIPAGSSSPVPTLTAAGSRFDAAYMLAGAAIEADVSGQIFLVSSPSPGQGASTVAMNLAVAMTKAGRRVVLIDGDSSAQGISRFGRTAATPGLAELAAGRASLAEASRLWRVDRVSRLPFIPSGDHDRTAVATAASPYLANAIDELGDGADLVLIDVPPVNWNTDLAPLAAHADGTLLVVPEGSDLDAAGRAAERLDELGAPVVGYLVNRADEMAFVGGNPWRGAAKRAMATLVCAALLFVGWNAFQVWSSWVGVERSVLDVRAAEAILPLPPEGIVEESIDPEVGTIVTSPPLVTEEPVDAYLVIGSDIGGFRADVIIVVLVPRDGRPPIMVSIPRDLYLPNRCTQGYTRVNANLNGCGDINGTTLMALAVEDYTGIAIDHVALFDFDGFEKIIDKVGGIQICVPNPVRDSKAKLDLPGGCTTANGEQALAWVRSRSTEEFVDGTWRTVQGVNDLTRNARQQDVIIALMSRIKSFESPAELASVVAPVADAFTLDEGLGLGRAIDLAWDLRDIEPEEIVRVSIPVKTYRTDAGALVLLPSEPFQSLLTDVYPDLFSDAV